MVVYMERVFLLCVGGSFVELHVLCFMTRRAVSIAILFSCITNCPHAHHYEVVYPYMRISQEILKSSIMVMALVRLHRDLGVA